MRRGVFIYMYLVQVDVAPLPYKSRNLNEAWWLMAKPLPQVLRNVRCLICLARKASHPSLQQPSSHQVRRHLGPLPERRWLALGISETGAAFYFYVPQLLYTCCTHLYIRIYVSLCKHTNTRLCFCLWILYIYTVVCMHHASGYLYKVFIWVSARSCHQILCVIESTAL